MQQRLKCIMLNALIFIISSKYNHGKRECNGTWLRYTYNNAMKSIREMNICNKKKKIQTMHMAHFTL